MNRICLVFCASVCLLLRGKMLDAAPQLRLSQTAVGPISVSAGSSGPASSIEASNVGDGTLNLQLSSSETWLQPTLGQARDCGLRGPACVPINIALSTAALQRGSYTGVITVSAPNAVDAPQTITVTVNVGGGIPERFDLYLPPNGSSSSREFYTAGPVSADVSTTSGGTWLAVSSEGGGSFRFNTPYRVTVTHVAGSAEGTYQGSIRTTGSSVAAENKTTPVTLQVTSRPIAQLSSERLQFRIAQNGPRVVEGLAIGNLGLGTLDVTGFTAATASGGNWLTVERVANQNAAFVTANPAGLAPGTYSGSIAVASNSVQGTLTIPATLTVVASGPPVVSFGGVINNGVSDTGNVVAQGAIVSLFGEQLLNSDPVSAQSLPLGSQLGAVRVFVNDRPAPVYYASYRQINFQIPYEVASGPATVRVERDGQISNGVSVQIGGSVPRLLELSFGRYAIAVNQDGTFAVPTSAGIPSRPARAGDTLVFYATGLGPTDPAVSSGTGSPSSPLARVPGNWRVSFGSAGPFGGGSAEAVPSFVGLTPNFVGLYQINVTIPADAPKGSSIPVALESEAGSSNRAFVAIQ